MKKNEELTDHQFDELVEIYKTYVEEEANRRTRRITVFWSSVSIFYIHGDLHLNIATTAEAVNGTATPWGIPIAGITEAKFLVVLSILTLYFITKFAFFVIKAHRKVNIWLIVKRLCSVDEHTKSFHTGMGSFFDLKQNRTFEKAIPRAILGDRATRKSTDDDYSDSQLRQRYDTWLFMYHYRIVGSLEYVFAPLIFPALLSIYAISVLAVELFC